jgi:hypothetical protein
MVILKITEHRGRFSRTATSLSRTEISAQNPAIPNGAYHGFPQSLL